MLSHLSFNDYYELLVHLTCVQDLTLASTSLPFTSTTVSNGRDWTYFTVLHEKTMKRWTINMTILYSISWII